MAMPVMAQVTLEPDIIVSNGDGWAEINIRTLWNHLIRSRYDAIISAPAWNAKVARRLDTTDRLHVPMPGQFGSVPQGAPSFGHNRTEQRWTYSGASLTDAVKYDLEDVWQFYFGKRADLFVSGINIGNNFGPLKDIEVIRSAAEVEKKGVSTIVFSGASGYEQRWDTSPVPLYSELYAALASKVIDTLAEDYLPMVPHDIFLNINFPEVGRTRHGQAQCTKVEDFKFIMTGMKSLRKARHGRDTKHCGHRRFPDEKAVLQDQTGCYATITVVRSDMLSDYKIQKLQKEVIRKLGKIISCWPGKYP